MDKISMKFPSDIKRQNTAGPKSPRSTRKKNGKIILLVVGFLVVTLSLMTVWWANQYLYATMLEPTRLSKEDQQILDAKVFKVLHVEDHETAGSSDAEIIHAHPQSEPSIQKDTTREIQFSEREVNALIAKDPEMAKYMAVDLTGDCVGVIFVVPLKKDLPLVGGKMLSLNFGLALTYANEKPVVTMRGISVGGIPLPRTWWGDIKDTNLVEEYGDSEGFWTQFAKGVEDLKIQDGQMHIKLRQ